MIDDNVKEFVTKILKKCHQHVTSTMAILGPVTQEERRRALWVASAGAANFFAEEVRFNKTLNMRYIRNNSTGNDALRAMCDIVRDQLYSKFEENEQLFAEKNNEQLSVNEVLKCIDSQMELSIK